MSFNLDDPLAGILSDESDDSFFDDDILGKRKPSKKKETSSLPKKNDLFELNPPEKAEPDVGKALFDFEDKKVTTNAVKTETKADITKSPTPSTFRRTLSKDSFKIPHEGSNKPVTKIDITKSPAKTQYSTSSDKLDILEEFNIERKKDANKLLTKGKSSQSLLDDILGSSSTKTGSGQVTRSATGNKTQEFSLDSILSKSEPKETLPSSKQNVIMPNIISDTKKTSADYSKKENNAKVPKKGDDWLGLFKQNEEDDTDTMPAWLGGGDAKKKPDAEKSHKKEEDKKVHEEKIDSKTTEKYSKEHEPKANAKIEESMIPVISTAVQMSKDTQDISTDGTAMYLQQQESQLMFALQLKAQEEKVAAMQMRQKETQRLQREAELAHQSQLESMLSRQAEHRRQMQAIISAHQERITERIKALLGTSEDDKYAVDEDVEGLDNTTTKRESPYTKEKKQLLQLVQSLQENHDKEIDLMETSYRRQLAFIEISSNQAEDRMKEETEKLVKFYSEKINWLEEHHHSYKKLTEENLNSITERHKAENEMLRQQHLESVRVLQEHHVALIENIKNVVNQEQTLIKDSTGFSSDLQELMRDIKENNRQCKDLVQRVENMTESTRHDGDRSLQTRESQINDMINQLKKERENFDVEKKESQEVVRMLEGRLKHMISLIEDETTSLKQKRMELEFEKATFSKQTEFAKTVLKRQEEEIKMLKDDIQKEYQDKISKIEEEKTKAIKDSATMAKEKISISNIKLDLEKMKAELQAQLEETTEERSKLSMEKQQLHIEEQKLIAKSRDIDLLAKTAIEKQSLADKKYSEAELLQKKYEDRIRRIQEHLLSLNTREKQIAKEKVVLSRERLNLHNEKRQIESKQHCSLCRTQTVPYDYEYNSPETFLNVPVSRDYSGKANGLIDIEQEIAEINLRQSYRNVNLDTGREDVDRMRNDQPPLDVGVLKDFMDPKFLMMRLDVQQVIHNLEISKRMDQEATSITKTNNEDEK